MKIYSLWQIKLIFFEYNIIFPFSKKKRYEKINKNLFLSELLLILIVVGASAQFIKKYRINNLIESLTPSRKIELTYKNINIIGYDILDKNKKCLTPHNIKFYPGNKFYLVLYGKRKITKRKTPKENRMPPCKACLEYKNGGYFWSKNTSYLLGNQWINKNPEEWKIGGIYKIMFSFKVPEYALPGEYKFNITKEKSAVPYMERLITLNSPKIIVIPYKIHKNKKDENKDLLLEGCLLNPAVYAKGYIAFYWTGNIEFYIDEDIRNFKKIVITAKGEPAFDEYPLLKIYINEKEIAGNYINGQWNKYEFDLKLKKESHILKVRFDNDEGGLGEDRNMYVRTVKFVR